MKCSGSVIIFSEDAFHLGWMGATRRLFHVAEAFHKLGLSVVLVAGRMVKPEVQEPIDSEFPGIVLRTPHIGDYPKLVDRSGLLCRVWRAGWKLRGQDVYWQKLHWGWAERLDMDWLSTVLASACIKPALAWGVSAGYLNGGVAAQRMARAQGIPWVLELHDPPRRAGLHQDLACIKARFGQLLNNTNSVVVTAKTYGAELQNAYQLDAKKVKPIYLGHEDSKPSLTDHSDLFTLAYVGTLNGGRSIAAFPAAIHKAFICEPVMRDSFRFVLAGDGPGFDEIRMLSARYKIEKWIHLKGLLTRHEADNITRTAAASVIVQPEQCSLQIPGKLFELLAARRPVIGLMPKSCEAAQILRESDLGFIFEHNETEAISKILISLWRSWSDGVRLTSPNNAYITNFSVKKLPEHIAAILADISELKK